MRYELRSTVPYLRLVSNSLPSAKSVRPSCSSIAPAARSAHLSRDRDVHHAAEAEQRVAARDDLARGVEAARVGLRRVHRDRAAGRVAAEQRALRAAQDLDAVEVVEHHGRALRARREHAVRVEGDALVARLRLVSRAEAADEDQRDRVVAVLEELQVRHQAAHVEQRDDAILVERRLVERADRERRVLQGGLAPRRGDDDFPERRLRLGVCGHYRWQAQHRAAQNRKRSSHGSPRSLRFCCALLARRRRRRTPDDSVIKY